MRAGTVVQEQGKRGGAELARGRLMVKRPEGLLHSPRVVHHACMVLHSVCVCDLHSGSLESVISQTVASGR